MSDVAVTENKQQHPLVVLRERLESRRDELKKALPSDILPDRFIRALITSATINPDLQACTWQSVWLAAMRACRDGLLPDGVEGAIVAYGSKAQWVPMYQGLLRRAYDSGKYVDVHVDLVRDDDSFEHWIDEDGPHIRHYPTSGVGEIVKVYALARTKNGGKFIRVMTMQEMQKHENVSRARREDAPWKVWREAMMKKTALRQLCKLLPAGREIDQEEDDEPEIETTKAPVRPAPRKPGAAAALDQFSQASPVPDDGLPPEHHTGAAEQGPIDQPADVVLAAGDVDRAPAPAEDEAHRLSIEAYKRGQDAKSKGHQRKAIPPEYRDSKRTREALCWQAGFDGGAMPEFDRNGKELVP